MGSGFLRDMSRAGWIYAVLLSAATVHFAQQEPILAPGRTVTATRDEEPGLIRLDVVVADKSGKPVSGLRAEDFSLIENGEPQKVLSFSAFDGVNKRATPPPRVILLVDTIEVPEDLARSERLAVESFLRESGERLPWPVSIYLLGDTGLWTVAHASDDGNALAKEIAHNDLTLLRRARGSMGGEALRGTAKEPPADSALDMLGQIATSERRSPGRKLLLWIGPGWGIGSGVPGARSAFAKRPFYAVCWFSTLLREARVVLYSFAAGETDPRGQIYKSYLKGVESEKKADYINLYRKVLAVQSGGRVVDESLDLVQEMKSCVRDADVFYRISFDPLRAERPDEYHALKVQIDKPELRARTTTGYYDQPFYAVERVPPLKAVSVAELEKAVDGLRGESDAEAARQLDGLELKERLSSTKHAQMAVILHGKRSQLALEVLADASRFRNPPADEMPSDATPDAAAQRAMLAKTAEYLKSTIPKLPDLFAKRDTVRYQERPPYSEGGVAGPPYEPMHVTDTLKATVHYRRGFEVADVEKKSRKENKNDPQLITYGTFGPVLLGVAQAITRNGGLTWSHWERGADGGRVAVFQYEIPLEKSLYDVEFCCTPDQNWTELFQKYVGYHGVIAIDPASGAILRLAWDADLESTTPMTLSEIEIEYGPVEIAGKNYVCPLRSISIVRGRSVINLALQDESFTTYGPYATMLNDISFSNYHVFRSDAKILPGFDPSN
jgi:VWFA-related protein